MGWKFKRRNDCRYNWFKKNSSLFVAQDLDELEEIKFKKEFIKKLGYELEILSRSETLKIEPNLNSNIEGSLIFKKHNQVEPDLLKKFLIKNILNMGGLIKKEKNLKNLNLPKIKFKLVMQSLQQKSW